MLAGKVAPASRFVSHRWIVVRHHYRSLGHVIDVWGGERMVADSGGVPRMDGDHRLPPFFPLSRREDRAASQVISSPA